MSTFDPIVIQLSGQPVGKGRHRFLPGSTLPPFTPKRTRDYEAALKWAATAAMRNLPLIEGPVFVTMTAARPIASSWTKKKQAAARAGEIWPASKPDADNILKTYDALNNIVWRDDAQVVMATVLKVFSDKPELRIVVKPAVHIKPEPATCPPAPAAAFHFADVPARQTRSLRNGFARSIGDWCRGGFAFCISVASALQERSRIALRAIQIGRTRFLASSECGSAASELLFNSSFRDDLSVLQAIRR